MFRNVKNAPTPHYKNLIHGSLGGRNIPTMELDLVEIRELSPPELWDLGVLSALTSTLLGVIEAGVGGRRSALYYTRMVVSRSKELRTKTQENLAMRIKAWVMQCPERIAWVRNIIGETAIRRWRKNRLADYALSRYFGDWQEKFSNGFENHRTTSVRKLTTRNKLRPYHWKLFSLTKIPNVVRFLYGRTKPNTKMDEIQTAYYKLWGTNIHDKDYSGIKGAQPRGKRSFKPVKFTPYELVATAATGVPKNKEDTISDEDDIVVISPPKFVRVTEHPPPENPVTTCSREPPDTNL